MPFKSRGLPTSPSTTTPLFTSQFPATATFARPVDLFSQHSNQPDLLPASFRSSTLSGSTLASTQFLESQPANTGSGCLSNVKSIPLLKLRQRQHAESFLQTKGLPKEDTTVLTSHAKSSAQKSPQVDVQERLLTKHSSSKIDHTTSVPEDTLKSLPLASTSTNQIGSSVAVNSPSFNRRRSRKGGKRAQMDTSATGSGSPQKENDQTHAKQGDASVRKVSSRQAGRKKKPQGNRLDSLPQSVSYK